MMRAIHVKIHIAMKMVGNILPPAERESAKARIGGLACPFPSPLLNRESYVCTVHMCVCVRCARISKGCVRPTTMCAVCCVPTSPLSIAALTAQDCHTPPPSISLVCERETDRPSDKNGLSTLQVYKLVNYPQWYVSRSLRTGRRASLFRAPAGRGVGGRTDCMCDSLCRTCSPSPKSEV